MPKDLRRIYGFGHLHYITFSCYRRLALLRTARSRNIFVEVLAKLRERHKFKLVGYVLMPEHVHLLMSEPEIGTPSSTIQMLKQRVSRIVGGLPDQGKTEISDPATRLHNHHIFWQKRFYDFNVFTQKKKIEKLNYMHMNPVKRGLVATPDQWIWSSYSAYHGKGKILIPIDRVEA
jgi:putative transposase